MRSGPTDEFVRRRRYNYRADQRHVLIALVWLLGVGIITVILAGCSARVQTPLVITPLEEPAAKPKEKVDGEAQAKVQRQKELQPQVKWTQPAKLWRFDSPPGH